VNAAGLAHRGTIFVEDVEVLAASAYADEQFVLRVHAPRCAEKAEPGSFIHLRCDSAIPMRRPLSIMRASPAEGWIDVLFKVVGAGLKALAEKKPGDRLSSMGPIGRGFVPTIERPRTLLIGGGVGIPPMLFLAERLREDAQAWIPLVLMGSEIPFPFELADSALACKGIDQSVNRSLALLESWRVPARLASLTGYPGTYRGYVTELANRHLSALSPEELKETGVFACGPTPMLQATADLAHSYGLPCQVSLEEFMACAVGGCAGCTVLVQSDAGPAMRRVCVDGPVFDAARVFPPT
jgi:dihydroorotate dehydrogenase electron transfer subunit